MEFPKDGNIDADRQRKGMQADGLMAIYDKTPIQSKIMKTISSYVYSDRG